MTAFWKRWLVEILALLAVLLGWLTYATWENKQRLDQLYQFLSQRQVVQQQQRE